MSVQGDVLKLKAVSASAFVRFPVLFWLVAAAVIVPLVVLIVGGRESNKSQRRRLSASDFEMKRYVVERESLDRFDDDGGNQQLYTKSKEARS